MSMARAATASLAVPVPALSTRMLAHADRHRRGPDSARPAAGVRPGRHRRRQCARGATRTRRRARSRARAPFARRDGRHCRRPRHRPLGRQSLVERRSRRLFAHRLQAASASKPRSRTATSLVLRTARSRLAQSPRRRSAARPQPPHAPVRDPPAARWTASGTCIPSAPATAPSASRCPPCPPAATRSTATSCTPADSAKP